MLILSLIASLIVLSCEGVGSNNEVDYRRNPKFLFLFPFYRVLPGLPCTTSDNSEGICLSQRQCNARTGVANGNCGYKGVCCVFKRTCGEKSNANNTYFFSPNFSAGFNGGKRCSFTIEKMNSGVCQIRIDFLVFSISEPVPGTGSCDNDKFNLGIPNTILCGENSGQHVYLDFQSGSNAHTISVTTVSAVSMSRRWNLKISQIACNSSERAPPGCLKYLTDVKGSDRSFNFSPLITAPGTGNRLITGMNYGVCVRRPLGFCSITWSPNSANDYTFTMSGVTPSSETLGALMTGSDCQSNFIIIPNSKQSEDNPTQKILTGDRYCGNDLPPVTTSSSPFVMTVVTTFDKDNINNRGFLLEYILNPCEFSDR